MNGLPVADASVVAVSRYDAVRLTTDKNGRFIILSLEGDDVTVSAVKNSWVPSVATCQLLSGQTAEIDFLFVHWSSAGGPPRGRCVSQPDTADVYRIR